MDFRYSRWDERLTQNLNFQRNLLSLYHRLLLMTDGNVEQALRALEEERLDGTDVLDAGTGSAVLALAAVALGARRAFGFDSDTEAIFVARDNLRLHPFGGRVALAACTAAAVSGAFRVVVANLLPEELLPMKALLFARVAPGGRLVASGIPTEREEEVVSKLKGRRWTLGGCRRENGWTCATLERG
jgi:ribosomal protein L11 methyltransferase